MANGLAKEVKKLRKELKEKVGYENVIGVSRRMQDVFCQVEIALKNDVNVHLYGEEGTGKKLLAQTIHFNCTRREKPFVAVNCFSMPESLLEREIFGHNESSISGNTSKTFGKFELANEGTFFLDQIDKMPLAIQLNFLHVLQKHKFNRTENEQKIDIDVRVITATNRNLEDEIKAGRFLKELHDQVKMFPITLPPLRERKEDIPTLTAFFIRRFHDKKKHQVVGISSKAMDYVLNYNWPGNINELKNVIEGAILNTHEGLIQPEHLPLAVTSIRNDTENKARNDIQTMLRFSKNIVPLEEIEKEALMHALKTTNYNMSTAANALGIGRTTIYRKVHKYGIPVPRLNWAGL
ncbi:MAG: sigma 54-interacting transcriptional regulator [bacterium]